MPFTSTKALETWYSQTFFTAGADTLAPGMEHKLVITPVQAGLFIDMITYDVPGLVPASPGANTGMINATITVTESATTTVTVVSPYSGIGDGQGRTSSHVGPIVGGVLGGLSLVCMLVLWVAYLKRFKTTEKGVRVIGMCERLYDMVGAFLLTTYFKIGIDSGPQRCGYTSRSNTAKSLVFPFDLSVSDMIRGVEGNVESDCSWSSVATEEKGGYSRHVVDTEGKSSSGSSEMGL